MSIAYLAAEDEIFGIANVAWLAAIEAAELSYAPSLFFPGMIEPAPPVDQIYAECSFAVVKEAQQTVGQTGGVAMYQSVGLFALQVYSPKADSAALRIAKGIASAVRDAFRRPSLSGEIWFRDQKLTPAIGNTTENQLNVVTTCTYYTIQ